MRTVVQQSTNTNKTSTFSRLRRLSTRHCSHLLPNAVLLCAVAVWRPSLSIDISCPRGAQQQTRRTLLQRSIDGTDRQTDRQTDAHRTPHTTVQTVSTIGAAENVSSSAAKRRGLSTRLMRLLTPLPPSERGSRQKAEGSRRKCVRRFCAALEFRNRCSRMWGARDAA